METIKEESAEPKSSSTVDRNPGTLQEKKLPDRQQEVLSDDSEDNFIPSSYPKYRTSVRTQSKTSSDKAHGSKGKKSLSTKRKPSFCMI